MSELQNMVVVGFVLPVVVVFFIAVFLVVVRILQHRERMAMIERGLIPAGALGGPNSRLQTGAVTMGVGVALTLGFLTMGVGPYLVAGLLPLFVGLALVLVNLVRPQG